MAIKKTPKTDYSVTEAAAYLGLSPIRVRQFCQSGRLGRKVGSYYVIDSTELREFSKQERPPGNPHENKKNSA